MKNLYKLAFAGVIGLGCAPSDRDLSPQERLQKIVQDSIMVDSLRKAATADSIKNLALYSFNDFGLKLNPERGITYVAMAMGDVDGDGDLDIIGMEVDGDIKIYQNKFSQKRDSIRTGASVVEALPDSTKKK